MAWGDCHTAVRDSETAVAWGDTAVGETARLQWAGETLQWERHSQWPRERQSAEETAEHR